jgi:LPS sulfotransferase NodH
MARFDGFVLFAEMRTGSNYLDETLNLFPGIACHGEAFNPTFIGQHDRRDLFGIDRAARDADPLELLRRIVQWSDGLGGFRFFHDHDARVVDAVLPDPRIAKVILTRNPLEAYVSRKIADQTGQWRLTDERHRKVAKARFDAAEFAACLERQKAFQRRVRRALQVSGQTAFELTYEQVGDLDVINGLAAYLGEATRLRSLSARLKRQNPGPLRDKVENFAEIKASLAEMDLLGLAAGLDAEPRQTASVGTYMVAARSPLLFMPLNGGPTDSMAAWMAALDGTDVEALTPGFTQKALRQWKNRHKDARSFAVLSHPVARAHAVFVRKVLATGPGTFAAIRDYLRREAGLTIPDGAPDETYDPADHRAAFIGFLAFLRRNLAGQTHLRTDPAFSTQAGLVQAMSEILPPDLLIRDTQLDIGLAQLCQQIGRRQMPRPPNLTAAVHPMLPEIYDEEVESAARGPYNRDYMTFGFRGWKSD